MEYLAFMKTKIFLFCVSLCLLFFLSSCGNCSKKIDCPGFNDSLLTALFPYTNNQQLVFKSINSIEQAVYTLMNTTTTQPYQAIGGPGRLPYCDAKKIFVSDEKDSTRQSAFTVTLFDDDFKRAVIFIHGNDIEFQNFSDTDFKTVTINGPEASVQLATSLTLGNRTFTNLVLATRDTTPGKVTGIYKIYYTKTEGLVGYAEYPSLKTWVKQ